MRDRLRGALIGTAIGDSVGLPWEDLHARYPRGRVQEGRFPMIGRGVLSDDSEQSFLVACALAEAGLDPDRAADRFARRMRWWFLGLPPGIGFGTIRACCKLLLGLPRGVRTAGNGAAMRVAAIGVALERDRIGATVDAITRVTHTDPRAVEGARVVAMAAHVGRERVSELLDVVQDAELRANLERVIQAARTGGDPGFDGFVSGYVNHTVPAAIFCWLRHEDVEQAVIAAVELGGDSDTVAAIAGGLVGASVGFAAIPRSAYAGIADRPLSVARLLEAADRLADAVEQGLPVAAPTLPWLAFLARNLAILPVFVLHTLVRRLG
jgi:ADP-ribosyl-[dinitrogen reductase] hydrolase